MSKVAVIGAGSWGTAIAKVLAENGNDTVLWCRDEEQAREINRNHVNRKRLDGVPLPEDLSALTDPIQAVSGREAVFLAVPSLYLLPVVKSVLVSPNIQEGESLVAVLTKGFIPSPSGPRLIVDTLEDYLPGFYRGNVVYVSGPSHAEEVARCRLTGLAAACANGRNAIRVRELLKRPYLLVFPSLDVTGVQICGAVKNVVAIAFGIMDAMKDREEGFGDNTESLLLAAGLNEIQALGLAMGATHPETFTSIAGVGDLEVTCRSVYGRNRRFGRDVIEKDILSSFSGLDDLVARIGEIGYLPEGVAACRYVAVLAERLKVSMPICEGVRRILNREVLPRDFMGAFMRGMG
jgi:glycerol-3-phosphate dehydrogenase (NAD(P)+)